MPGAAVAAMGLALLVGVLGPSSAAPRVAAAADLAPPGAGLFVDGEGPFEARRGGHCLFVEGEGQCIDRFPPAAPVISIDGHDGLTLVIDDGWRIVRWNADYRRYSDGIPQDGENHSLDRGRAPDRDGSAEVGFTGPPPGDWRLDVTVGFHGMDATGDISLQWRLSSLPVTDSTSVGGGQAGPTHALVALLVTPLVFGGAWLVVSGRLRRREVA